MRALRAKLAPRSDEYLGAAPDLLSFALITDEPPPEVRARGHDRCIIPIREQYLDVWLNPQGDLAMSQQILSDREPLYFKGRIVSD